MYLKRLEVHGFKSMADKIELHFNPGITAVVGPNGSGKSNISDAIRWVLGEQSAKSLRGAKMEDIIFSGSDKRKPVGMAEVILTLDNSTGVFPIDFSEVNVTRRMFRSGDSEFFINKTPCRLKDIHELFMDTGIGREGYSIIGQGKIDEILSTKSEDRRLIIEEAAGIVKYKNRKLQAVKKLDDTEQNLVRIYDIISELENQVGPLEEQAQKATTYIGYKEELDRLEISLSVQVLADQKEKLESYLSEEKDLQAKVISLETEMRKSDSVIEELKHTLNITAEKISQLQQAVFEKSTEIEKLEADIRLNTERVNNLSERRERLCREVGGLNEKAASIREQSHGETEHYKALITQIASLDSEAAVLEKDLQTIETGNKEKADDIERAKGEIIETLNKIAGLNNTLHALEAEEKSIEHRRQQLDNQLKEVTSESDGFTQNINNLLQGEKEAKEQLGQCDKDIKAITTEINENLFTNRQTDQALQRIVEQRQGILSKLKVLQEMEQEFEGYQKGVKEVLKVGQNGKLQGICGVVAELISVPQEYETAIEVALGGALQFIVTSTDSNAKAGIDLLKRNNLGRATFLPLNTVKHKELRNLNSILKSEGCLGVAADLVRFKSEYGPAVQNLLGNIIIAKNTDTALKIAKDNNFGFKIVTLDGDVMNPGGSLTGGSYTKNRSNLLGRKRQIEDLQVEAAKIEQQISDYRDKQAAGVQKLQVLNSRLDQAKEMMQTHNLKIASLTTELEQVKIQQNKVVQTAEVYQMELDQHRERIKDIGYQKEQINGEIVQLQQVNQGLNVKIAEGQKNSAELESRREQVMEKLTGMKVELARLKQEEVNYRQSMDRIQREIDDIIAQVETKNRELAEIEDQTVNLNRATDGIRLDITRLTEEKIGLEETLNQEKNARDNLTGQINSKEEQVKKTGREFSTMQNQMHTIEVRKARLEAEIEGEQKRLLEEFALSYEEAMLQRVDIGSKREATSRIKELKALIGDLGAVNVAAIEEFAKVSERYTFLQAQYKDLEEAKQSLYKVIEEMDQIMSKRFRKAYEDINQNFTQVFYELFGGGHAELQMTDKENILETGVEIIAQPPGKKPQHLSLLSGGERALTAISLLFAVLMVKPSPFCVLDEIEASLDEANVDRFADFLTKFSQSTQFIVVTHRKGTMEAANVLYGVTMDESGVSKMVSMKLTEAVDKVS